MSSANYATRKRLQSRDFDKKWFAREIARRKEDTGWYKEEQNILIKNTSSFFEKGRILPLCVILGQRYFEKIIKKVR